MSDGVQGVGRDCGPALSSKEYALSASAPGPRDEWHSPKDPAASEGSTLNIEFRRKDRAALGFLELRFRGSVRDTYEVPT